MSRVNSFIITTASYVAVEAWKGKLPTITIKNSRQRAQDTGLALFLRKDQSVK